MDESKMSEAEAALRRARLHLSGGKRRLQQGLTAAGVVALYDSVLFGMRYYIARHKGCRSFVEHTELWDAASLFHALTRAGVFENPLTFNRFNLMVERALWQRSFSFDVDAALAEVESILTKLGVMPFNESALPAESPVPHVETHRKGK
jgi:hypothetical protein